MAGLEPIDRSADEREPGIEEDTSTDRPARCTMNRR
jgi:hypothetical protein